MAPRHRWASTGRGGEPLPLRHAPSPSHGNAHAGSACPQHSGRRGEPALVFFGGWTGNLTPVNNTGKGSFFLHLGCFNLTRFFRRLCRCKLERAKQQGGDGRPGNQTSGEPALHFLAGTCHPHPTDYREMCTMLALHVARTSKAHHGTASRSSGAFHREPGSR